MTKTVLVTGASSGFGEATARRFAAAGHSLIITARRLDQLQAVADSLAVPVQVAALDMRDGSAIDRFCDALPEAPDILVNNAGLALGVEPAQEASLEEWETMVDTNIKGLIRITRRLLPGMLARGRGQIVNMGSIAGSWPYPGGNVYGATKAFVQQFSRGLRADLVGTPIRVNNIEPGMALTNFSNVRMRGDETKASEVYAGTQPLTAEDIAEAVFWVCSLPEHVNINAMEIMPTCQAWGGWAISRSE